jgi:hypothetical protein
LNNASLCASVAIAIVWNINANLSLTRASLSVHLKRGRSDLFSTAVGLLWAIVRVRLLMSAAILAYD